MRLSNLLFREIAHRKFHFMAGLVCVAVAVGCGVSAVLLLRAFDARTEELQDGWEGQKRGITGRCDHLPDELSAGEKQRTALARALLHCPRVLLADEPTGNLDQDNGRLVVECLRQFADAGGAVLMVTHDHRWEALADRTVTLEFGRLAPAPA